MFHFRCNGSYKLTFAGTVCPKGIYLPKNAFYRFYAFLDGLGSDNLAYINQASDSILLKNDKFQADVYRQYHSKRLVAAFKTDCRNSFTDRSYVEVKFNLKKSYFNDLMRSVQDLEQSVISRIMPVAESFNEVPEADVDLKDFKLYCSEEQLLALRSIVVLPSNSPPILLVGAFGTGKSRLLALFARYLQKSQPRGCPVRILVCTQQRVSADKFLEYYLEAYVGSQSGNVIVIREYALDRVDHRYREYYMMSKEFKVKSKNSNNILVITTCLTAPHLEFLKRGYFTHIVVDEGSQMREPEAVAPLYLADANTKIVIAGDQNQVLNVLLSPVKLRSTESCCKFLAHAMCAWVAPHLEFLMLTLCGHYSYVLCACALVDVKDV